MSQPNHLCPACGRPFEGILDYPVVHVLSFERLPIPEAVDTMSKAVAKKRLDLKKAGVADFEAFQRAGINLTPEIARACGRPEVQDYLKHLDGLSGREICPRELLPPWQTHGTFKWAYPITKTDLLLSLADPEPPTEDQGVANVMLHGHGPNLGSAGGPTLQPLGPIGLLRYRGLTSH